MQLLSVHFFFLVGGGVGVRSSSLSESESSWNRTAFVVRRLFLGDLAAMVWMRVMSLLMLLRSCFLLLSACVEISSLRPCIASTCSLSPISRATSDSFTCMVGYDNRCVLSLQWVCSVVTVFRALGGMSGLSLKLLSIFASCPSLSSRAFVSLSEEQANLCFLCCLNLAANVWLKEIRLLMLLHGGISLVS